MRGRPLGSNVRQNIVEILAYLGKGYGYDICRIYNNLFPKTTMRNIYYHLKKGLQTQEFKIEKIKTEKGDYSWGNQVEKTYYSLGEKAQPVRLSLVKDYFTKKASSKTT